MELKRADWLKRTQVAANPHDKGTAVYTSTLDLSNTSKPRQATKIGLIALCGDDEEMESS